MRPFSRKLWALLATSLGACNDAPQTVPPDPVEQRISQRAVVAMVDANPREPWWLEERLSGIQATASDRDLGPRQLVRAHQPDGAEVVFAPASDERLTAAVRHPSGDWSATVVAADYTVWLVRGSAAGSVKSRILLTDLELPGDRNAWNGTTAPTQLLVALLTEDSVRLAAAGEHVVVTLTSRWNSVLAYRWSWQDGAWVRGPRTLLSPTAGITPYIPDTASYDIFEVLSNSWSGPLCTDSQGRAFIATWMNRSRLATHNSVLGTALALLRADTTLSTYPTDILLTRVDADGHRAFQVLVGTADVEDEAYGIACGPDRVAVVGRHRLYPGRDNTELHVLAAAVSSEGQLLGTLSFDAEQLGIAQSAAVAQDGSVLIGGTEGFTQNPSGFSVGSNGHPFLLRWIPGSGAAPERLAISGTSNHAELRALALQEGFLWTGGIENGPLSHTYDSNRAALRGDGWLERRSIALRGLSSMSRAD